jgi:recombination endonuclease VII
MRIRKELSQEQLERRRARQREYRAKKDPEAVREYARKWYREHKDRYKAWSKKKFDRNPERHRAWVRKNYLDRAFGTGGAEYYDKMFAEQNGRCAICGEPARPVRYGRLHQDHDTACCPYDRSRGRQLVAMLRSCGKCRRGLLCNNCNTALSGLERVGWLRKALRYLRKWGNTAEKNSRVAIADQLIVLQKQLAESLAEYDQKRRAKPNDLAGD